MNNRDSVKMGIRKFTDCSIIFDPDESNTFIEPLAGVFARHFNCFEDINNPTEEEWDYFFMIVPIVIPSKEAIKKRFFSYVKWSMIRGLHE